MHDVNLKLRTLVVAVCVSEWHTVFDLWGSAPRAAVINEIPPPTPQTTSIAALTMRLSLAAAESHIDFAMLSCVENLTQAPP